MSTLTIIKALELGLIFSVLALGEYITFRILNIADLTVDGSFATGGCVCAMCSVAGHPLLGLVAGFIAGSMCGFVTAFLQTKMKIQPLLSGILVMLGLYSINIRIMKMAPNVPLPRSMPGLFANKSWILVVLIGFVFVLAMLLYAFFKSNLGLMLRATGDNEEMIRSSSVNVDCMKFLGLALSNGLVALAGGLLAQYQHFADVTMGTGMLVLGVAGIIVGEAIFRKNTVGQGICAAIVGSICYRLIYTFALKLGFRATDMNLVNACLVALTISIPMLKKRGKRYA